MKQNYIKQFSQFINEAVNVSVWDKLCAEPSFKNAISPDNKLLSWGWEGQGKKYDEESWRLFYFNDQPEKLHWTTTSEAASKIFQQVTGKTQIPNSPNSPQPEWKYSFTVDQVNYMSTILLIKKLTDALSARKDEYVNTQGNRQPTWSTDLNK
jgi:hypothetical protein